MKFPKIPHKPFAPFKPGLPPKQISNRINLGELTSQEDGEFSVQWFVDYISQNFPNVDPSTIKFSMEVNKTYGYYDEVSTSLDFHFYTIEMVDNPNYTRMYNQYEAQLEKYHKDYEKYKTDLEKYKVEEKKYKENVALWQLEQAKAIVAKHEKKNKKK